MKTTIITGSRAEWGLLEPLVRGMMLDSSIQTHLIVTGAHLSQAYGMTIKNITLPIDTKIECILSSDTATGVSKAMGLALISFAETYERIKPNLTVVLGDRYEILAASEAAHVANIPIAHIHGGETTEGAMDNAFRHSITHMASLHFTACEEYRQKVISLGKAPETVFNVGCLGLENLPEPIKEKNKNQAVLIWHPETLAEDNGMQILRYLIPIIRDEFKMVHILGANADQNGRKINRMLKECVEAYNHVYFYESLPRKHFLALLNESIVIVGNSSAGIYEAPALGTATINIGNRQKGRLRASSVIDCIGTPQSIAAAFDMLWSDEFQESLQNIKTPYTGGNVSSRIVEIIKKEKT